MLADTGDPVAAVQQLQRERSAQIAREYTCLAGVSRGRRLIWSGRPGVWYYAHLIDLGRRPDTTRAIYDVLAAHGGAMSAQDLAIAAGVHGTTITRCYQKRPDVFATEYRGKSWHDGRRLYVWLVDQS